jgi:signal transduction histidine kinase
VLATNSLLRTPLLTKLVVLDLAINVTTLIVLDQSPPEYTFEVNVASLALVLVLNAGLVAWALLPLRVLEETARRVSDGDYGARARMGFGADRNLTRIGDTLNALIDSVTAERGRVRALAAELVAAGDRERAQIARDLHDGTAQSLSALDMLLESTVNDAAAAPFRDRLLQMQQINAETLSEVRTLSHNVHPRVLDDLGLPAAFEALGRRMGRVGVDIRVTVDAPRTPSATVASVLYRVGQEALNNALRHGRPRTVDVRVEVNDAQAQLEVQDDGVGFDRMALPKQSVGMGLFMMQERVALVEGTLSITSAPGKGTTVTATIPMEAA